MRHSRQTRAGFSLAEVLIAIFALAIGLLGIMSLFPLAAMNMANAIQDENTTQLGKCAGANFRYMWKEETTVLGIDPYPATPNPPVPAPHNHFDPFFTAMIDPNYPFNPDLAAGAGAIPLKSDLPPIALNSASCYPVYLDPVGWNNGNNAPAQTYWVGGLDPLVASSPTGLKFMTIPRRSLRRFEYVPTPTAPPHLFTTAMNPSLRTVMINRLCFRLDDMGFGKDGTPYSSAGDPLVTSGTVGAAAMAGEIQRDGRYSCAFMLKRRSPSLAKDAELSIVVYSGRSIDAPSDEKAYQTTFAKGSTEATLDYLPGQRPNLRRGNWILDATMTLPNGQPDLAASGPHGYFYRIINISDDPITPNRLILELQSPAKQSTSLASGGSGPGLGIVMDRVVEVFEYGTLTSLAHPTP